MCRVHVRQTYRDPHRWERAGRRLGPLDEADRVLEVRLEIAPLGGREALKAEEVEVRHVGLAGVAVADREGRARDRRSDAERPARAADEGRLAAAELARNRDDVADGELTRERRGDRLGLLGRRGTKFDQNRPSWTAGSAATGARCGAGSGAVVTDRPMRSGRRAK